jgi:hypothetical protein
MATSFTMKLAGIAQDLHDRFHLITENDPPLANQIEKFWTSIGLDFPGIDTAWSAVFVSFCMKQAGATAAEFKFNPAHSQFVNVAIRNGLANTGVFRGRKITDHAPSIGDVIHMNRGGNEFDFDFARTHKGYKSHSAIVVEVGVDSGGRFALTIGGNESDSIRSSLVRLRSDGLIKQRNRNPFICVIEDLK